MSTWWNVEWWNVAGSKVGWCKVHVVKIRVVNDPQTTSEHIHVSIPLVVSGIPPVGSSVTEEYHIFELKTFTANTNIEDRTS